MTFKLDTSGNVGGYYWSDLSLSEQGYIEALFNSLAVRWDGSPCDFACSRGATGEGWVIDLGFSDLAPESLRQVVSDCDAYCLPIIELARCPDEREIGRIFWEDRQKGRLARFPPLSVYTDGEMWFETLAVEGALHG